MIDEILKHIEEIYPEEACGLIVSDGKRDLWIPCKNVSDEPEEEFVLDNKQFINAQINYKIKKIVHSHTNGDPTPSEHDIKACNFIKIPYLIVGWPGGEIEEVIPNA